MPPMSPPFDPSPPASTTLPPPDPTPPTPTTLSPPDPIALQLLRPLTPLQQLRALDRSSPMFHDQLFDFLGEKGFKDCISNLEEPDAIWLVNFLDMLLRGLDGDAFGRVFEVQRAVCGTLGVLPESYITNHSPPVHDWTFGGVNKSTLDGTLLAVKYLEAYTTADKSIIQRKFCKEVVLWKSLEHPNVLPLLCVGIEPLVMISEWMTNGNVIEYIKQNPEADRIALLSDVAGGLKYLHDNEIIHGDLKGGNILIDDTGRASISDFGFHNVVHTEESTVSGGGGTLRWSAPEILMGKETASKPADVYAFAMVSIEVFTGRAPFADIPPTTVAVRVISGKRPQRPTHPCLTDRIWCLTKNCWAQNHLLRPAVSEVHSQLSRVSLHTVNAPYFLEVTGRETFLADILRKSSEWPSSLPFSFRRLFSRFRRSGETSPPAPNGYDIKVDLSNSCISVDSWGK